MFRPSVQASNYLASCRPLPVGGAVVAVAAAAACHGAGRWDPNPIHPSPRMQLGRSSRKMNRPMQCNAKAGGGGRGHPSKHDLQY